MKFTFRNLRFLCVALIFSMGFALPAFAQGLALNITDDGYDPIPAGGTIAYAVRIDNSGNTTSNPTTITFTVPENARFTGVDGELLNCSPETRDSPGEVICEIPPLAPQARIDSVFNMVPVVEGTTELNAQIGDGGPDGKQTTTVSLGADLSVTLSGDTARTAGEVTDFVATVHNNGPYPSDGATLTLALPTGLSRDVTMPAGCEISDGVISCTVDGPIAVDAEVSFPFSTQITTDNASTITIPAALTDTSPRDPVNSNDNATHDISVAAGTDVSIGKSRAPTGLVLVGNNVEFTLSPRYAWTPPTEATITDELPANYAYVLPIQTGPGWTCADPVGQTLTCEYSGTIAEAENYITPIVITANAVEPGEEIVNTATIIAPDDVNPDNNTGSDLPAHIQEPNVDLDAQKSGPPRGLVAVGNSYPFTLHTENDGNAPFWGRLTFTDHLPAGMTVESFTAPAGWSCAPLPAEGPADLVCETDKYTQADPLFPGERSDAVELSIAITDEGNLSNGLTVGSPNYSYPDPDLGNNTTDVAVESGDGPRVADIQVIKNLVGSQTSFVSGNEATFEIEVVNNGLADAVDVVLDDRMNDIVFANPSDPGASVTIAENGLASGLACTVMPGSDFYSDVRCTMDALPQCEQGADCPRIRITALVGDVGAKVNSATAFSLRTPDPDTANNTDTASYTVTPMTDVSVTKDSAIADGGDAQAGLRLEYVITANVLRDGLSPAEAVTITDTLPDGVRFVGAVPSTGTCTTALSSGDIVTAGNNQLVCDLGTIDNGSQQTVTVSVTPTTAQAVADATITNQVAVSTTTPEVTTDNNSDEISHKVTPPVLDLLINKSDGPDPVEINANTIYNVRVTNNGPSSATNVDIIDTFPAQGMAYVEHTPPAGSACDLDGAPGGSLSCRYPYLPAGESIVLTVEMAATERGRWTNTVKVDSDETRAGYETQEGNNETTEDTTVRVRSDVEVTKTVSSPEVALWDDFTWTVNVASLAGGGLELSENVTLADMLPANMELTGAPISTAGSCTGTAGGHEITCELGDINAGSSVDVVIPVKVTSITSDGQVFDNSASAETDSFDANQDNNTGSAGVIVNTTILSGTVWRDFNADGDRQPHDTGIPDLGVTATRVAGPGEPAFSRTVTTRSDGTYDFTLLPPGVYTVSYNGATDYVPSEALPGDQGGTANDTNSIEGIVLGILAPGADYDFTLIPQPEILLTKTAADPVLQPDGESFRVTYDFSLQNNSEEPIEDVSLTDTLTAGFGTFVAANPAPGEFSVDTPTLSSGFTFSNAFDGAGDPLLASGGDIPAGGTANISVTFHVNPTLPRQGTTHDLINDATMEGTGEYSGRDLDDMANHSVTLGFDPGVTLVKTATPVLGGATAVPGDRIDYAFTVTNTGNTPLLNLEISDQLPDLIWDNAGPITRLNPGDEDSTSFEAHYILTQDDIDNGRVENTATVVGQWGVDGGAPLTVSDDAAAIVETLAAPELTVVKSIVGNTISDPRTEVGETISYSFVVTNTGNVNLRDVELADILPGIVPDPGTPFLIGDMPVGDQATVYAEYAVTQADIDAGEVRNTATATGVHGPLDAPTDATSDEVVEELFRDPGVILSKVVDPATVNAMPMAGDEIVWTITIENTGNVTLENIVVTDPKDGATVQGSPLATLAPSATNTDTITVRYALTQEDINAGEVVNQARLVVTSPGGTPIDVPSGNNPDNPNEDPTIVPLAHAPSVALLKAVTADLSGPLQPGDPIAYRFTIRNTGNVPVGGLALTDSLAGFVFDDAALSGLILQPASDGVPAGEVEITGEYILTEADIEAGQVTNTAEVTGNSTTGDNEPVSDTSGTDFDNDDPTEAALVREPSIALVKTIDLDASQLSSPVSAGDDLHFAFAVHNTGNMTLTDITLSDIVGGVTVIGSRAEPLVAGEVDTSSFTATYTLTQDDIEGGEFVNRAHVSGIGTGENGSETVTDDSGTDIDNDEDTVFTISPAPALTVEKAANTDDLSANPAVGEIITYSFTVTNTGNVMLRDLELSDPLSGLVLPINTIDALAPGADTVLTATYELTQADVDAFPAEIRNIASVNGSYGSPDDPQPLPGPVPSNEIVVDLPSDAAITLVKTQVDAQLPEMPQVGDTVSYAFTVTNTGNVTLADVTVTDALDGIVLVGGPITLAPGELDTDTFTATYAITQADITRGYLDNSALATGDYGDPADPSQVTDVSGTEATNDDPTRVVIAQRPVIELEKFADLSGLADASIPVAGEEVLYRFTVRNTGNMALSGVTVTDDLITFDAPATAPFDLAPGEYREDVFVGRYALTQEDIDSGSIDNTATVDGTAAAEDGTETPVSDEAAITTVLDGTPDIALVKTVNVAATQLSDPPAAGDVVHFAFAVTNTGNLTLSDLELSDVYLDDVVVTGVLPSLAPGVTDEVAFSATYVLTQSDIDAGMIENQARVVGIHGVDVDGTPRTVEDLSGSDLDNDDLTELPLTRAPGLSIVKTADETELSTPPVAGETIGYAFVITNTGNVSLTDVVLSDDLADISIPVTTIDTLAPGTSQTLTASYVVTQDDIDRGEVENRAAVTGVFTDPATNTPTSLPPQQSELIIVPLAQEPSIALTKSAASAISEPAVVGEVITYTFTVTNTGNVVVQDVELSDPLTGITPDSFAIGILAPGAEETRTATYVIAQEDIDAGQVINQATATGSFDDGDGPDPVTDLSGTTNDDDEETVVPVAQNPGIALIKTAEAADVSDPAVVGQEIRYSFTVTNTGNVGLRDVVVADPLTGLAPSSFDIATLAPQETVTVGPATYAITQADISAQQVENRAEATGTYGPPGNERQISAPSVTDTGLDEPTVVPLGALPSIALIKTLAPSVDPATLGLGDVIAYHFRVINTGNVPLEGITLTDTLDGVELSGVISGILLPGEEDASSITARYTITQADIDAGQVVNTAEVSGRFDDGSPQPLEVTDISGLTPDTDEPTVVPLTQQGAIALIKTSDGNAISSPAQVGDEIRYSFAITNTGDVTLSNVTLADTMLGSGLQGSPIASLAPGQTDGTSYSGVYLLTQADLDAGRIENQAEVTGGYGDDGTGNPIVVSDLSGSDNDSDAPNLVEIDQEPSIALIKTADASGISVPAEVGETITYAFTVSNTGNVTLTDVTLTDALAGIELVGGPIMTLAPGEVDETTFSATYALTEDDIAATAVVNTAVATGNYESNGITQTVEDTSGSSNDNDDETRVDLGYPELGFDITVADLLDRNGDGIIGQGDEVVFSFTVTNTGTVPLYDVAVDNSTLSLPLPGLICQPVTLAVGASAVLECTGARHVITAGDVANGEIILSGDARGESSAAVVVTASSATAAVAVQQGGLTLEKMAGVSTAVVGDVIPYTINVANDAEGVSVGARLVDTLPEGFVLRPGTARLDGDVVVPDVSGRRFTLEPVTIQPGQERVLTMDVFVSSSVRPGLHTNRVRLISPLTGRDIAPEASATVRIEADAVFQCSTVLGRVFDDRNQDGHMTEKGGEKGLPNVRLISPKGIAIHTDEHGRFSVPCAALPRNIGGNFMLRLDERTLPSGYRLTTENPRVVRVTPGMITRLDFGATLSRLIRVDLAANAFDGMAMSDALHDGLRTLVAEVRDTPAMLRITYQQGADETDHLARERIRAVEAALRRLWPANGRYQLNIETTIQRARAVK